MHLSLRSAVKQEEEDASRPAVVNALRTAGPCGGSEVTNNINTVQYILDIQFCFVVKLQIGVAAHTNITA